MKIDILAAILNWQYFFLFIYLSKGMHHYLRPLSGFRSKFITTVVPNVFVFFKDIYGIIAIYLTNSLKRCKMFCYYGYATKTAERRSANGHLTFELHNHVNSC